MGRKNTASNRSAQHYIPPSPLGEVRTGLSNASKIAMKVIGVLMATVLIAFFTMAYGGQGTYLFVYWSCLAPLLVTLFVLGLVAILFLFLRGKMKTSWSRLGITCAMVISLFAVLGVGIGLVSISYSNAEIPIAYLRSPAGERIVIMRSTNLQKDADANGVFTTQYTGYQMLNRYFYLAMPALTSEPIYSDIEPEPKWEVEWMENDDARLYLPEHEGEPFSETFITVYDLSDLQASLSEKGSGVYHSETQDMEPLDVTPAPSVDPFAY